MGLGALQSGLLLRGERGRQRLLRLRKLALEKRKPRTDFGGGVAARRVFNRLLVGRALSSPAARFAK